MLIQSCPEAYELLMGNVTADMINTLRKASCGFTGQYPRVCCDMLKQESTEVRSPNAPDHPSLRFLPEQCGVISGDRIFGGQEADLYEFPWMVLISYRTKRGLEFKCGGSIINEWYVLTAAHCIVGQTIAGVRIGEHDIASDTDCQGIPPKVICESRLQDIRVAEEIPHENYSTTPFIQNDIGLLKLKKPIDFTPKNARPICLPTTRQLRNKDVQGQNATVAGWGYTENGRVSDVLLSVRVPIYTAEDCANLYDRVLNTRSTLNKLCAGEVGKDTCGGDSGGPLLVTGQHNGVIRYIQYGVVSYGPRLCASNYPGVYTDITKYMDWIFNHIKE